MNDRIRSRDGRLRQLLDAEVANKDIVRKFYGLALSRSPTPMEVNYWDSQLTADTAAGRLALMEDFVWGLLVCREFVTNH